MAYPIYTIEEDAFPGALAEIPDKPDRLSVRGTLPPEAHTLLAVVGSRAYSTYGKQVVDHLISGLRAHPITIVSGLAIGIDALAHQAALRNGMHTIAIPGSGLNDNVLYPARHRALAREILERGGALLSEFDDDFSATPWAFPQRNRIVAGMSSAVLVVEAALKSGALITARLAVDYNRDVLAVPGSIFSDTSAGTHFYIGLGATPVTSSDDILRALGMDTDTAPEVPDDDLDLAPDERRVLAALSQPRHRDELIRILGMNADEANALIMLMELRGYLSTEGGEITKVRG